MKLPELPIENFITADFETYYDPASGYTLSKMSAADYIRDERFEVIGVGIKVNNGPSRWMEEHEFRAWLSGNWAYHTAHPPRVDWSRAAVLAHNGAGFDHMILSFRYGIKAGFWLDTLQLAKPLLGGEVGGSLAKLSKHFDLGEKGNEVVNAKGKRRADFTQEEWEAYGRYCCNDCDLAQGLWEKLSPGFPEEELWLADTTTRFATEPGFKLKPELAKRFHREEQQRKADLLARITVDKSVLMSNDQFAALLLEKGAEVPTKVSAAKSKKATELAGEPVEVETWALAKSDPGFQELLEHPQDEIRWLAEARLGIKSTINETRAERLIRAGANDQLIAVQLNYYGAHTGRWSGAGGMNFQNMPRTKRNKDGSVALLPDGYPVEGHLRCCLAAPDGYSIVVVDSGQIEVRVEGWVAGHDSLMDTFRRNDLKTAEYLRTGQGEKGDVYSDFGSTMFGEKISEATHPIQRFVSKFSLLGCGYQLGGFKFGTGVLQGKKPIQFDEAAADKFGVDYEEWAKNKPYRSAPSNAERCSEIPSRLPFRERVIHFAVAHHFVNLYREQNPPIVNLWDELKGILEIMLEDDADHRFGPGGCLRAVYHAIELPNGMRLRYPGLARSGNGFSYMGGFRGKQRVKAYGGSMAENITQALARIIVARQMLQIRFAAEKEGGRLLMMSHDEVVSLVPDAKADPFLDTSLAIMRTPPDWCADLPLNASGGVAKAYGDAK